MTEILAPAGSQEVLEAAVRAGANAVYFGGKLFNARQSAANFESGEFRRIVSYCHLRGVRAYFTLNTLIFDEEIKSALELTAACADAGIDGIIVTDLGLADLIRRSAPDMPLHASTQMTVHTPGGIRALADLGFRRAVLARELSEQEIIEIKKEADEQDMELELFVHGALCMSVSGQCLLSALLGGRSGNRGRCAGPCRLPFKVSGGNGYDLSLKDNCLIERIARLKEIGVDSFKIEGRMKRAEYVASAVAALKTAIDTQNDLSDQIHLLENIFSRSGFTSGYFDDKRDKNMFGIKQLENLSEYKKYLTSVHDLYRTENQSVALSAKFTAKENLPVSFTVTDGTHTVTVTGDMPSAAQNKPIDSAFAQKNLGALGGTPYYLEQFDAEIGGGLYFGGLKQLRREAVETLSALREKTEPVPFRETIRPLTSKKYEKATRLSLHSISQLPDDKSFERIYLPLSTKDEEIKRALSSGYNIAVKLPNVSFGREKQIINRLIALKKIGITHVLTENLGQLPLIEDAELTADGGIGLNLTNSFAVNTAKELGLTSAVLSAELTYTQIEAICADIPVGFYAYGCLPLMTFRNCPIKASRGCGDCDGKITDRMNTVFPVSCEDGVSKLYNDRPVFTADLKGAGISGFLFLSFTNEPREEVNRILNLYETGGSYDGKCTKGLFYKGVL